MQPIRVLVVDDSAFIRAIISACLRSDPGFTVVGMASNGRQAVEMAEELRPDFITLDVNMPEMDGLEALRQIMQKCPTPVIMVSSLTAEGAKETLEALSLGALDFIYKDAGDTAFSTLRIQNELIAKIRAIGNRRPAPSMPPAVAPMPPVEKPKISRPDVVAIGASTGGPNALQKLLTALPKDYPAAGVIVQHMPPAFLEIFAERLNTLCQVGVKLAEHGEPLRPGTFLIGPGNFHLKLKRAGKFPASVVLDPEPGDSLHRPSVDQLFTSVAVAYPSSALGVIMTGMGQDGLEGAKLMKAAQCGMVAQDEASCVVYGMPRAIVLANLADHVLPLSQMHEYLLRAAR
ncbi:MAG: chemotaxis response regulator protein-glutamate methylesterase [Nitrospinae bacterium]|nr:chemotaxis response regulator protein-glutamate methylesterase [Nitrospinota bacterium]